MGLITYFIKRRFRNSVRKGFYTCVHNAMRQNRDIMKEDREMGEVIIKMEITEYYQKLNLEIINPSHHFDLRTITDFEEILEQEHIKVLNKYLTI